MESVLGLPVSVSDCLFGLYVFFMVLFKIPYVAYVSDELAGTV